MWFFVVQVIISNLWLPLVVAVSVYVYWHLSNQSLFWERRGVPFIKSHWLFGNFENFVRGKKSLTELTKEIYDGFNGERFGGIWQMRTPTLFIMDPNLLRDVMVKDFNVWATRGITVNLDVDPLSAHLINLNGKMWKSVRSKLTPTFTSGKLEQMHYLLMECGMELENYLDRVAAKGEPIDVKEMAAQFTTDVIGSCVFGIEMNALNDKDALFRKMGREIFRLTFKRKMIRMLQTSFPGLFKLLKLTAIDEKTNKFFLNIVKESFEYREKNNVKRHDFIDLLRQLKNTNEPSKEEEVIFDDELLAAQAFVFFGAGFETSSTAISYCLHELAINQNVQDRLRDEIRDTIAAANDGKITYEALKKMKYLDMVVHETLRKHPPITLSTRKSLKPYRIPGSDVDLPAGTSCIIPIYALHHDPDFYPEPEKFDPERFADGNENLRSAPYFIPFGDGPRVCIGTRFAKQQVKLGLLKTVENFKISLCEKSENPLQHSTEARFLSPKNGIWLSISPYNRD